MEYDLEKDELKFECNDILYNRKTMEDSNLSFNEKGFWLKLLSLTSGIILTENDINARLKGSKDFKASDVKKYFKKLVKHRYAFELSLQDGKKGYVVFQRPLSEEDLKGFII